mmetsp:Transcript_35330/g.54880  ORF Transcript_35330/g.54880 Transcript_35330/m.54880 type:complete len:150 (+) Transcript_35330:961-1410(+)
MLAWQNHSQHCWLLTSATKMFGPVQPQGATARVVGIKVAVAWMLGSVTNIATVATAGSETTAGNIAHPTSMTSVHTAKGNIGENAARIHGSVARVSVARKSKPETSTSITSLVALLLRTIALDALVDTILMGLHAINIKKLDTIVMIGS